MNALLNLFDGFFSTKAAMKRRPLLTRPCLEAMEERLVPAASSLNIHAVALPGSTPTSAVFVINSVDHSLYEITPSKSELKLAPPNAIGQFSAGTTATGVEDVFAVYNGSLAEYDSLVWHYVNQPMQMRSFAAVADGRAYAVGADLSLWSYAPPTTRILGGRIVQAGGWSEISGANTAFNVDAVTETNGTDILYIQAFNGNLKQYITSTQGWSTIAGGGYYTTFAAGLDANGYAEAYYLSTSAQLDCYHIASGGSYSFVATIDPRSTISATHDGHVFTLGANGLVNSFKDTTSTGITVGVTHSTSMSAATASDLYQIGNGSLVETTSITFGFTIVRIFGVPAGTTQW